MELIRGWPILLVLHYAKKVALHIKLQKMLFLAFSEAKVKIPYNFTKFDYGPYDPDVKIDFLNLSNKKYIKVIQHISTKKSYWAFRITKEGEKYVEENILKTFSEKEAKRVERLVLKYNKMDWRDLVSLVYERYDIQKSELDAQREFIKKELERIRPIWLSNYEKIDCDHTFTTIAMIDYVIIMLNKKRFDDLDIMQYNVLIKFLNETTDYLRRETASFSLCPKAETCKPLECDKLLEIKEIFLFAQYLGEKFKILPSTFSEDAYLEDFEFEDVHEPHGDESRTISQKA